MEVRHEDSTIYWGLLVIVMLVIGMILFLKLGYNYLKRFELEKDEFLQNKSATYLKLAITSAIMSVVITILWALFIVIVL